MSDVTPSEPTRTIEQPSGSGIVRSLLPSLLINGVLPVVLYQILKRNGVATVPALVAGSIFPIGTTLWSWLRTRRADIIGVISFVFIIISAAASLLPAARASPSSKSRSSLDCSASSFSVRS